MKHLLLILSLLSTVCGQEERKLKVEATQAEWVNMVSLLRHIQQYVDNTNLPHQEVIAITRAIDSMGVVIVPQLQKQLEDTTKTK